MTDTPLVNARRLTRRFGPVRAVDEVGFELHRGDVLGFLGPNGAGKSTTMQMLTGTLAPSRGTVEINGINLAEEPRRAKALIGYLPESPPLYRELTVDEYLHFCARLHGLSRAAGAEAVEHTKARCGLADTGPRLLGNLSRGYQQRAGIAQAILHTPEVVILDEPTVGLDPIQIREIRDLIAELGADHSVILSTHILPEVQAICSRAQIIHEGRLVYANDLTDLERRTDTENLRLVVERVPPMHELKALPGVERVRSDGHASYRLAGSGLSVEAIARRVIDAGWGLREISPRRRTLEEVFVELTTADQGGLPSDEDAA